MFARAGLVVNTLIFSISAVRKVKDLLSTGHFLMGPGKIYPGWLLPVALVHECANLLLLFVDRPAGVLGCCAFIGGIAHAQTQPTGPFAKVGLKALGPLVLVCLGSLAVALTATDTPGPISNHLGFARLRPQGLVLLGVAASAGGFVFGSILAAANAGS